MKFVPVSFSIGMIFLSLGIGSTFAQSEKLLPIADAHVHYSHDSVEMTPPERVIEIMREANLKFALVSSSDNRGTTLLTDLAPDLIVPGLRPYTRRGQMSSWFTSEENLAYVEELIENNRYASIGEFHLYGEDADLPIPRRIVELAKTHNLLLHAHSDVEAIEWLLAQSPDVKVLWAHSGFEGPEEIAAMLDKHDRLWADLAFRSDVGRDEELDESWQALFTRHPNRMMLGTDTFTPERIHFIPIHAEQARHWLATLPEDIAERVAWKNAYDLIVPIWEANREDSCNLENAEYLLESEGLSVSIQPMAPVVVSQAFPVTETLCGNSAAEAVVTLNASMPSHGHGMNYKPPHIVLTRAGREQLFSETLFSGDDTRSCVTCHDACLAFSDERSVAIGKAQHVCNTQGLLDVAQQRWFGWDGGADSLWAATLRPILSPLELDGDIAGIAERLRTLPEVTQVFNSVGYENALYNDEALVVLASKAMAAYVRTLTSKSTPFDAYRTAVLNESDSVSDYPDDARRGLSIFFGEGNCHVCHFGPVFSNLEFHDTGRPFYTGIGQVDPGRYTGIQRVRSDRYNLTGPFNGNDYEDEIRKTLSVTLGQVNFGQWRTPSLRNLVYTAPYMHDGSLATLREVVDAYADIDSERIHSDGEAIIRPLALDDQDREDLVAFLKSLSIARQAASR